MGRLYAFSFVAFFPLFIWVWPGLEGNKEDFFFIKKGINGHADGGWFAKLLADAGGHAAVEQWGARAGYIGD